MVLYFPLAHKDTFVDTDLVKDFKTKLSQQFVDTDLAFIDSDLAFVDTDLLKDFKTKCSQQTV